MKLSIFIIAATVATASAFCPAAPAVAFARVTRVFSDRYGIYDDKLWDTTAKTEVYNVWDPSQPRTVMNFNPFETFEGNSPDASGRYPGESFYKDPIRGDMNYAIMQAEQKLTAERAANPKPGSEPGCPGCKN